MITINESEEALQERLQNARHQYRRCIDESKKTTCDLIRKAFVNDMKQWAQQEKILKRMLMTKQTKPKNLDLFEE